MIEHSHLNSSQQSLSNPKPTHHKDDSGPCLLTPLYYRAFFLAHAKEALHSGPTLPSEGLKTQTQLVYPLTSKRSNFLVPRNSFQLHPSIRKIQVKTTATTHRLAGYIALHAAALFLFLSGCTDEDPAQQCVGDWVFNPDLGRCESVNADGDTDTDVDTDTDADADGDPNPSCQADPCFAHETCYEGTCYPTCSANEDCGNSALTCESGACVDLCDFVSCNGFQECFRGECRLPCDNLECQQVTCPTAGTTTTVTGTVTIPAGTLPLPDVNVYIPNAPLEPMEEGASCMRCDEQFSGDPLVLTTTNINGEFVLENVPVGSNIPLVIQIGKWRRLITLPNVDACTNNPIVNQNLTRLPRNSDEGHIPKIAITTGGWDALECLALKIGIDESEFTSHSGDGRVNLFAGRDGANRFANRLNGGASFTDARNWWNSLNNLEEYDIILHSCEGDTYLSDKPLEARQALQDFTDQGGRVFMSHWQNVWLNEGPSNGFGAVANWTSTSLIGEKTGLIDASFAKGELLRDWLVQTGTPIFGQINIMDTRGTIQAINQNYAQRWIWLNHDGEERTQYFSFNAPVGADEDQQCGRVVFSDIHVAGADRSSPSDPFPNGCISTGFSDQEKALVFMFFDLANCIVPDCERLSCADIDATCGTHPDGCGGSIECGPPCCLDIDGSCDSDGDCCDNLWCEDDIGRCTDRCRNPSERCKSTSDCCTGVCSASGGNEGICIVQ